MTSWHRNRRGRGCTTPRCRSQNIANNTFSEGWLQKSKEFAGLRTAPATHHAKNTPNTTFSCGMLQNAGFGTIPCGGGGGGSEPRTGNIYTCTCTHIDICDICIDIFTYSYTRLVQVQRGQISMPSNGGILKPYTHSQILLPTAIRIILKYKKLPSRQPKLWTPPCDTVGSCREYVLHGCQHRPTTHGTQQALLRWARWTSRCHVVREPLVG